MCILIATESGYAFAFLHHHIPHSSWTHPFYLLMLTVALRKVSSHVPFFSDSHIIKYMSFLFGGHAHSHDLESSVRPFLANLY